MNKINPNANIRGIQAAEEASADYRLEQKGSKKAKETKAKESASSSASNSELARCIKNMNVAVDKWDARLRDNLEDWYQETQELAELTNELTELTQQLTDMTDESVVKAYSSLVPAKGDNKVLYEGEAAVGFAEAMVAVGLGDTIVFSNATINGQTGYYYLTPNQFLSYVSDYQKSHNGELPSMEVKVQPHSDNGKESPSPQELQVMIADSVTTQVKTIEARIKELNTAISETKKDQNKTMLKVMGSYTFKNANIKAQTSLIDTLHRISENILRNLS